MRAIPQRLRGMFMMRCYTNPRLSYLNNKKIKIKKKIKKKHHSELQLNVPNFKWTNP